MANFIDLTNKNFGRWTVVGFNHTKKTDKYTYQMWDCLCSCGSKKVVEGSSLKKGNSVSCGCYNKESIPKGKNHYQWKEKPGYWAIHVWLRKHFGKPCICEGENCRKNSNSFNWALKKGMKYERSRDNFIRLCRSCHMVYDDTKRNFTWYQSKK
jgi:hypothetical protein